MPATVPVAIVGAGPVGLSLALGLARHGVRTTVLERHDRLSSRSRAAGIHVRTREVLRRWDVEHAFLAAGHLVGEIALHDVNAGDRTLFRLDFGHLEDESRRPGLLMLEQSETERLLLEALAATGCSEVVFGAEVRELRQQHDHVRVSFRRDGSAHGLAASYVVGCDGAGSFVRDALGLPFDGVTYGLRPVLADVTLHDHRDELPWPRIDDRHGGFTVALRLRSGLWRIIHLGSDGDGEEVPDGEVQRHVRTVLGPGPTGIEWSSRFQIHRRSSPRLRCGRVLLAGDAAHVHSPIGGQGMNAGIQDAHDLAWKLSGALDGGEVDRLLDSYEIERRAVVVGKVTRFTDVLTRIYLQSPARLRRFAFGLQRTALRNPRLHRLALRRLSMLDLRLPSSPLLDGTSTSGIRLPDVRVRAPDGAERRLHDLLPLGPALLEVSGASAPAGRTNLADLPVDAHLRFGPGGHVDVSGALRRLLDGQDGFLLVRPDGYLAWSRSGTDGLGTAVRASIGLPT